jgi:hypothetical protein
MMKPSYLLLSAIMASLVGCAAPSKDKLKMMTNYDLCEQIYRYQISAIPGQAKYYWEEVQSRGSNCEAYSAQLRDQQSRQDAQMLNFFGAMGIAAGVSSSGQTINVAPTTNNNSVQPRPLPPVIISPPNTIPKK